MRKLEEYESVNYVNARGMVGAIILHQKEIANTVVVDCVRNGVMPVNTWSTSIKIGPPLTISISAIEEAFNVIERSIERAENG